MWVRSIHTKKIKVAYISSLLFYIDLRRIYYFIMFYFKLTNDAKFISFLTNIESIYFFVFEHNIFANN